jgi:uncharacterized membrane protein
VAGSSPHSIAQHDAGEKRRGYPHRSVLVTGIALGIGIMGFLDEVILHQLLQWHTFYWATDPHGRILSDGFFHVFSTLLLVWGSYRLWRTPQPWLRSQRQALYAAILIGAGGFNAYDGIVQHLLLHFHLVNEYVCPVVEVDNSITSCPQDIPSEVVFHRHGVSDAVERHRLVAPYIKTG